MCGRCCVFCYQCQRMTSETVECLLLSFPFVFHLSIFVCSLFFILFFFFVLFPPISSGIPTSYLTSLSGHFQLVFSSDYDLETCSCKCVQGSSFHVSHHIFAILFPFPSSLFSRGMLYFLWIKEIVNPDHAFSEKRTKDDNQNLFYCYQHNFLSYFFHTQLQLCYNKMKLYINLLIALIVKRIIFYQTPEYSDQRLNEPLHSWQRQDCPGIETETWLCLQMI